MKFGVVVCSKCNMAKGVNLSSKTTKCTRCGRVYRLEKLRILFKTDSEQKLTHAVGIVNKNINR